jgi:hypothetical protein
MLMLQATVYVDLVLFHSMARPRVADRGTASSYGG